MLIARNFNALIPKNLETEGMYSLFTNPAFYTNPFHFFFSYRVDTRTFCKHLLLKFFEIRDCSELCTCSLLTFRILRICVKAFHFLFLCPYALVA